jgi:hypothetical protein
MELCKDKLNQLGDVTKKSSTAAAVSQRIFVSLIPVLRELLIIFCIVIMLLNDRQIEKIKSNKKQ